MSDPTDNGPIGPLWAAVRELEKDVVLLREGCRALEVRNLDLAKRLDDRHGDVCKGLSLHAKELAEIREAIEGQRNPLWAAVRELRAEVGEWREHCDDGVQAGLEAQTRQTKLDDRLADAEHRIKLLQAQRDEMWRRISECTPPHDTGLNGFLAAEFDARLAALERARPPTLGELRDAVNQLPCCRECGSMVIDGACTLEPTHALAAQDWDGPSGCPMPGSCSASPPLRWTKTPPSAPGWYWYRDSTCQQRPLVLRCDGASERWVFAAEWAGPIATPEEP